MYSCFKYCFYIRQEEKGHLLSQSVTSLMTSYDPESWKLLRIIFEVSSVVYTCKVLSSNFTRARVIVAKASRFADSKAWKRVTMNHRWIKSLKKLFLLFTDVCTAKKIQNSPPSFATQKNNSLIVFDLRRSRSLHVNSIIPAFSLARAKTTANFRQFKLSEIWQNSL